jgi:hypothetical protein
MQNHRQFGEQSLQAGSLDESISETHTVSSTDVSEIRRPTDSTLRKKTFAIQSDHPRGQSEQYASGWLRYGSYRQSP